MTAEYSKWKTHNTGRYVEITVDETEPLVIDLKNELDTGDYLLGTLATSTSTGITINTNTVRTDTSAGYVNPHQQLIRVTPTEVGNHPIKAVSTTRNGKIIVKHFDVLTVR